MTITQGQQEKSRLGRLLINRGYITESELETALQQQRASGVRLGEMLIAQGFLTEKDIGRILRHQKRYRNTAAMVAMVTLPLQPMVSLASTAPTSSDAAVQSGQTFGRTGGLTPLSDAEMGSVSGQGGASLFSRIESVKGMADGEQEPDAIEGLKLAAETFLPVLNFLDSELTISGVYYDNTKPRMEFLAEGKLRLALPKRIDSVEMKDIRVGNGASMGSVTVTDIRFDPASSMTIYGH